MINRFLWSTTCWVSSSGWVLLITSMRSGGRFLGMATFVDIMGLTQHPFQVRFPKLQSVSLPQVPSSKWGEVPRGFPKVHIPSKKRFMWSIYIYDSDELLWINTVPFSFGMKVVVNEIEPCNTYLLFKKIKIKAFLLLFIMNITDIFFYKQK